MARIGVAIVHYRAESLLRRSLEALCRSTADDFTVVIVDHGSETGLTWADNLDSRISVVRSSTNRGFAAGTNLAVRRLPSSIDHVLLLNPDVFVEPDTLRGLADALDEHPELGAVTGKLLLPDGTIDPACRRSDPTLGSALARYLRLPRLFPHSRLAGSYNLTNVDASQPHDIDCGTAALLLVRASVFAAVGGMDERFFLYGEDLDFCRRLRAAGYRLRYLPEFLATHDKGSGQPRRIRAVWEFHHAMWLYYRKWGERRDNPLVLMSLAAAIATLFAAAFVRFGISRITARSRSCA
jgi:N-acetylglucosaminyl-diphospho-decaprenol L-rhamnosyltransferase